MERIEEFKEKLKGDVDCWEEKVFNFACDSARILAKEVLEELDNELMQRRDDDVKMVAFKEHWLTTIFGDIRIKRRLYQDKSGNYRFLLDEKMGLDKGSHVSPKMKELAILASTRYTFREVEQIIKAIFPWGVSHTTIHNISGELADSYIAEEEKEINALFEDGVIPETKGKVVPHLVIEADGVNIALQREESRKAEVKIGIAHEGWQEIGKDRYKLKDKSAYSGIMRGDRFWEGFSLILAKKYNLSQIAKRVIGGDGAPWVKAGAELVGGLYELDKFHLKRALHQGLANDPVVAEIYQACITGEIEKADSLLVEAQDKADSDKAKEIMRLRGYLMENSCGLRDYRLEMEGDGLRGLGAIEGNVDKLIADRMKKRGMSWTKRGANRMARLISLREMGKLNTKVKRRSKLQHMPVKEKVLAEREQYHRGRDDGARLNVGLPALHGPHSNRPWAQVLWALAHGNMEI